MAASNVPAHVEHGKLSTYNNYRCRCEECKAANADRSRDRRASLSSEQKRRERKKRKLRRIERERGQQEFRITGTAW